MIALVPSRIAFATSEASARVGSGAWIIDSSICVAVITGLPRSRARRMIRFCRSGTATAPISTPRSPRATITASASRRMSSSTATASAFSIFAITCAVEPDASISVFSACTSEAERTNESATKSQPSSSANWRSSMSFRVSDGIGSGMPGRLTPLCEMTVPPTSTSQSARPRSTVADPQPHRAVVDQDVEAGLEDRAEHGRRDRQVAVLRAVLAGDRHLARRASSSTGSGSSPMRSFGPCRSAISATGVPVSSCAGADRIRARARGPRACRARS